MNKSIGLVIGAIAFALVIDYGLYGIRANAQVLSSETVPVERTEEDVLNGVDGAIRLTSKLFNKKGVKELPILVKECYKLAKDTSNKWTCVYIDLLASKINLATNGKVAFLSEMSTTKRVNKILDDAGLTFSEKSLYLKNIQNVLYPRFNRYMDQIASETIHMTNTDESLSTEKFNFEVIK
jgi:hypothetical protein